LKIHSKRLTTASGPEWLGAQLAFARTTGLKCVDDLAEEPGAESTVLDLEAVRDDVVEAEPLLQRSVKNVNPPETTSRYTPCFCTSRKGSPRPA
jgi:hypothetical protein